MSSRLRISKILISRIQLRNSRRDLIAASKELLSIIKLIDSIEPSVSTNSKLLLTNLKAQAECNYINVMFYVKQAQKELRYSLRTLTETTGSPETKLKKYLYIVTRTDYFINSCYLNINNVKKLVLETFETIFQITV